MVNGQFLKAIFLVLSGWLIWFFVFVGLGILIRRKFFDLKITNFECLLSSFWIGWAYTIFFLQLWNLCFKIDWYASLLVCIAGFIGLIWNSKIIFKLITKGNFLKKIFFSIILLSITLWIADRAILISLIGDSGLYHLSAILWAKSYPVILGLGNLHGRLAFNNSYFLYVAMLEVGPWLHKSQHLANGLLLLVLIAQVCLSVMKLFKSQANIYLYNIFYILLLCPIFVQAITRNFISSPHPYLPIYILEILLAVKLLAFLEKQNYIKEEKEYNTFFITTIAVLGITIKLSFLAFGVISLILLIAFWLIRAIKVEKKYILKVLPITSFCIIIALIPWMIRGIISSGYIAYPSTFGAFPVEWRIPYASVANNANWVYSWSRMPNVHWSEVLGNWNWLKPWLFRIIKMKYAVIIPLFITFFNISFILFLKYLKKYYNPNALKNIWWFLLPSFGSLIFWFFTAPNLRFAGSCFWILGAGTIVLTINYTNKLKNINMLRVIFIISIVLCIVFHPLKYWFIMPKKNSGFCIINRVELKKFETNSGLIIYVPKEGSHCYDGDLPCTPYPNADLRLRREGNMRYGFMIYPRDEQDPTVGMHYQWPPP